MHLLLLLLLFLNFPSSFGVPFKSVWNGMEARLNRKRASVIAEVSVSTHLLFLFGVHARAGSTGPTHCYTLC